MAQTPHGMRLMVDRKHVQQLRLAPPRILATADHTGELPLLRTAPPPDVIDRFFLYPLRYRRARLRCESKTTSLCRLFLEKQVTAAAKRAAAARTSAGILVAPVLGEEW